MFPGHSWYARRHSRGKYGHVALPVTVKSCQGSRGASCTCPQEISHWVLLQRNGTESYKDLLTLLFYCLLLLTTKLILHFKSFLVSWEKLSVGPTHPFIWRVPEPGHHHMYQLSNLLCLYLTSAANNTYANSPNKTITTNSRYSVFHNLNISCVSSLFTHLKISLSSLLFPKIWPLLLGVALSLLTNKLQENVFRWIICKCPLFPKEWVCVK